MPKEFDCTAKFRYRQADIPVHVSYLKMAQKQPLRLRNQRAQSPESSCCFMMGWNA